MNYYENENYYDILGVEQDASLENIQRAKDRLKFGGPDDKVPFSMWGKIDEAYSVLSDREKRREYDEQLKVIENNDMSYDSNVEIESKTEMEPEIIDIPEIEPEFIDIPEDEPENEIEPEIIDIPEEETYKEQVDETEFEKEQSIFDEEQAIQSDLTNIQNEEDIFEETEETFIDESSKIDEAEASEVIDSDNQISTSKSQYIIDQLSKKAEETFTVANLKRVGKNIVLAIPTAVLATGIIIKELEKNINIL